MCISGVKFKEHCSNISRSRYPLIQLFTVVVELVITPSLSLFAWYKNVNISKTKEDTPKGKRHSSVFWKAFQKSSNYSLFHRNSVYQWVSTNLLFSVLCSVQLLCFFTLLDMADWEGFLTGWRRDSFHDVLSQCTNSCEEHLDSRVAWWAGWFIKRAMFLHVLSISAQIESRHFDGFQDIWLPFANKNM